MRYLAEVIGLDALIEEAVTIKIEDQIITGFASICPYPLDVGNFYTVSIELWSIEGLSLQEINDSFAMPQLQKIGTSLRYIITGRLEGRFLNAGVKFEDPFFEQEYNYLSGHMVRTKVDRIQLEFLPRENSSES